MADFPSLAPSTRSFTPGFYPYTPFSSMSGEQSRIRHSSAVLGGSLALTFVRVSEADRIAVEMHYHGQLGSFVPFALSAAVFSGFNQLEIDPFGLWRYAGPPQIEDHCGPTATIQVNLVSVPGGAPGAQLATMPIIVASAGAGPGGAQRTVNVTLSSGAATAS